MFSHTHAYIADMISKKLREEKQILLNNAAFRFGSIIPDFSPKYLSIGHYMDESMDFITGEALKLSKVLFQNHEAKASDYSKRLGIIVHYVSDYFCYAHNDDIYKKDKIRHFFYEADLKSQIGKLKNSITIPADTLSHTIYKDNFIDYLENKLKNYNMEDKSHLKDINYALEASYTVCNFILTRSLNRLDIDAA
ncbi:hypothetical protein OXPF_01850 [Oxobacter pfennigii]|uniref:Phospholipase C/D domain-containing protein n=1 Tax=Oxobacter pfennigii TaxID=36849 RepID=A0A0P8X5H9_9CLOT|nr:zinc dependent phospholipase C family protein [Oxobacter pfennigii]KPU46075.1 hypothetical protein OXPF_01850 [Oxobacter pfennigii]